MLQSPRTRQSHLLTMLLLMNKEDKYYTHLQSILNAILNHSGSNIIFNNPFLPELLCLCVNKILIRKYSHRFFFLKS